MKKEHILFIVQRKYLLKSAGVPRSQWRRLLGNDFIVRRMGTADEFVATWNHLGKMGLL